MADTFAFNFVWHLLLLGAEEKREEAETQASELLIKQRSLDELLAELGSKGPRSVAKSREQVMIKHWQMIVGIFQSIIYISQNIPAPSNFIIISGY